MPNCHKCAHKQLVFGQQQRLADCPRWTKEACDQTEWGLAALSPPTGPSCVFNYCGKNAQTSSKKSLFTRAHVAVFFLCLQLQRDIYPIRPPFFNGGSNPPYSSTVSYHVRYNRSVSLCKKKKRVRRAESDHPVLTDTALFQLGCPLWDGLTALLR